jgi:hypothetical protein
MRQLTREQIKDAYSILSKHVVRTPCIKSQELSQLVSQKIGRENGVQIFIKLENKQTTGSFKYRGALHSMLKLRDEQLRKGVVTYSTGILFSYSSVYCSWGRVLDQSLGSSRGNSLCCLIFINRKPRTSTYPRRFCIID